MFCAIRETTCDSVFAKTILITKLNKTTRKQKPFTRSRHTRKQVLYWNSFPALYPPQTLPLAPAKVAKYGMEFHAKIIVNIFTARIPHRKRAKIKFYSWMNRVLHICRIVFVRVFLSRFNSIFLCEMFKQKIVLETCKLHIFWKIKTKNTGKRKTFSLSVHV